MDDTEEIKKLELINRNNELVQLVQDLKMIVAKNTNERLDLMKENNELRMQMSRLKNSHDELAKKLDAALQKAAEESLTHIVQASTAITRVMEITKTYLTERQDLEAALPKWNFLSGTPATEKVHRVPPMMGGRSIQPVVLLNSATFHQTSPNSMQRNQNMGTERSIPLHMLQDVYVPVRRINIADYVREQSQSDSIEDLGLEDLSMNVEESPNITTDNDNSSQHALTIVAEEAEEEIDMSVGRIENPLEGPSWLLDVPISQSRRKKKSRRNHEPDSTTENEEATTPEQRLTPNQSEMSSPADRARIFSPTVRRPKRASPPVTLSSSPDMGDNSRILQVLVPKLEASMISSPPTTTSTPVTSAPQEVAAAPPVKRPKTELNYCDTSPSVVDEGSVARESQSTGSEGGRARGRGRRERADSEASRASTDSAEGATRTRRPRRQVEYKEMPLNRKMRR